MQLTSYEREPIKSRDVPRWENALRWYTGDVATVGWMSKREGLWSLTEAGADALEAYDAEGLLTELQRRYREIRKRREQAVKTLGSNESLIVRVLSLVDPGAWTSFSDVASIAGVDAKT